MQVSAARTERGAARKLFASFSVLKGGGRAASTGAGRDGGGSEDSSQVAAMLSDLSSTRRGLFNALREEQVALSAEMTPPAVLNMPP